MTDSAADRFKEAQRLHTAGQFAEAQSLYAEVIQADPHDAKALYLLGTVLAQRGRFEQAVAFLRRAIAEDPKNAVYQTNLGVALHNLGRLDQAKAAFDRAIKSDRLNVDAYYNLAKLYKQLELPDAALMTYEQVLSLDPGRFDAIINMGNILVDEGRLDDALTCFSSALAVNPDSGRAYINLGNTYRRMGEAAKAIEAYDGAIKRRRHGGLRIKRATTLPVVYGSTEHILEERAQYEARVWQLLEDESLTVVDPSLETSTTNFFLAYQNQNDRDLQKLVAKLHLKSCPGLGWTAPHCENGKAPGGRLKIGFISTYFRRHSIGRLMIGLLRHLPADDFEIVLITQRSQRDPLAREFQKLAAETVFLPDDFWAARQTIAEQELDILFYADIGMDVRTYFLAFARLAPVQCVTWGHPDTTGIPNIDYFVSSDLIEPDGADAHYSEKLHRLSTLPTLYPRPELPDQMTSREALGLSEDETIYLCPQSAIKHHPDLDILFAGILRGDQRGRVVVVEGAVSHWSDQVRERWQDSLPDVADRIHMVPRQSPEDFVALQAAADVILDTPHFSGGNTSFESFALAQPIVTLDGDFMRGRVTAGMYRMMEIDGCTAGTLDEYVAIALKLGTDENYRDGVRSQIIARQDRLFDRKEAAAEFIKFFNTVVQ